MANIKSAKKRIRVTAAKTLKNRMIKSSLKTSIKGFDTAVANNSVEEAKSAFVNASKALDMAASKGVVHKNMAARKKSRMAARLNGLSA
jgi:small subunit ribosomal protein S20